MFDKNTSFATRPGTPGPRGPYPWKARSMTKTLILCLPAAFGPRDPSKTRILGLIAARNPLKTRILGSRALQKHAFRTLFRRKSCVGTIFDKTASFTTLPDAPRAHGSYPLGGLKLAQNIHYGPPGCHGGPKLLF